MNFGEAIEAAKSGKLIHRAGWNGKGMHVYLESMLSVPVRAGAFKGEVRKYDPFFVMFTAKGTHQAGWLASQADMLAEDWEVVS